jgi:hypoxanthine phosphoribosyltransferase
VTVRPQDERLIIRYSWEEMDRLHREVARQVERSGFAPQTIVGVMRCGQVSAVHLAYILGVPRVASVAVKTMASDAPLTTERVPADVRVMAPSDYLAGQRVLLVDAVMESGTTAQLCLDALAGHGVGEVRVAMITDWYTSSYKIASGVRPRIDFTGQRVTMWPDFPWEH